MTQDEIRNYDPGAPKARSKNLYYKNLLILSRETYPKTVEGVRNRLRAFHDIADDFEAIPTLETLSLALGANKATLMKWLQGGEGSKQFTPEALSELQMEYQMLQAELSDCLVTGDTAPAGSIFVLKNNHGYKDTTNVEFTPKAPEQAVDMKKLAEKYKGLLEE